MGARRVPRGLLKLCVVGLTTGLQFVRGRVDEFGAEQEGVTTEVRDRVCGSVSSFRFP